MSVSICVPRRSGEPSRDRAWRYCSDRLRRQLPGAEIVVGNAEREGGFSIAASRNAAVAASSGSVLVLIDADMVLEDGALLGSIATVGDGPIVAYKWLRRCTPEETDAIILSETFPPDPPVQTGTSAAFVLTRAIFEAVGGFDERFVGWGGEDNAFRRTVKRRFGVRRYPSLAFHLWHPRSERGERNRELMRREYGYR